MKIKKSTLLRSIIIAIIAITLVAVCGAVYATDITDGKCGNNVNWSYSDGTLTISGEGMMYDYRYDGMLKRIC